MKSATNYSTTKVLACFAISISMGACGTQPAPFFPSAPAELQTDTTQISNQDPFSEEKARRLSKIAETYHFEQRRYQVIYNLFNESDTTHVRPNALKNVHSHIEMGARNQMPDVSDYIARLAIAHKVCQTDSSDSLEACKLPEAPSMGFYKMVDLIVNL